MLLLKDQTIAFIDAVNYDVIIILTVSSSGIDNI